MNDIKSKEYILLTNIEQKTNALASCSCLLSLNAISLSVAVDACRVTKYLEVLLAQWRQCLPLGDAKDVNFPLWGNKIWEMIQRVRYAYSLNKVEVNSYQFESECFLAFKERQAEVDALEASMEPFRALSGADVPTVAVCALRELNEVLMQITEFLNSPTEELISSSFEQWEACYQHHYRAACHSAYHKWKIQYSPRTLRKNLQERMRQELEQFKQMFLNDGEFELVFDVEQQRIDSDGLSRFLFTHADRFGVSFIDARPMFSANLIQLFNFVELWRLMQADQQPARKRAEKAAEQEDELEKKVLEQVSKVQHLATEQWAGRLPQVWKSLLKAFHSEIAKAGAHEKFKEYSKKTVYCILGYLKSKGFYRSDVTNVAVTRKLEGSNNGMRKYVSNGLAELDHELKTRIEAHVEQEMQALVV